MVRLREATVLPLRLAALGLCSTILWSFMLGQHAQALLYPDFYTAALR